MPGALKRWKQRERPQRNEWINKMLHVGTKEYYSAIKRTREPTHATAWVNLEDIMPNERCWRPKVTCDIIPLMWNVADRWLSGPEDGRNGEKLLNRKRLYSEENMFKVDRGGDPTTL